MASSSQALLIKFTWLSDHQQVWAPLYKLKFWQFAAPEHSGVLTQRQSGKTSRMIFNKNMLLPINLASVKRPFPNNLLSTVWWIIHKWKTFKTCQSFQRCMCHQIQPNPQWDCAMLRDTATNPRAPFQNTSTNTSDLLSARWWRDDDVGTLRSLSGAWTALYTKMFKI